MMALRDCVRRYGRLPESIVVDGGKEFRSTQFEVICAFYRVTIVRRPPRKGRYGAQIERFFGTHNTMLLHTLQGNTQLRKNVRQMTPAVDPSKTAVWTLLDLHELLEKFYFTIYDSMTHTGILRAPKDAFALGMARHGTRRMRHLAYDQDFLIMTCPGTPKGRAKVQPDGVKINHFYYHAPGLSRHLGKSLEVRYEPFDLSIAYAYFERRWQRVNCRFDNLLSGLGEHELALVTAEYQRLNGKARRERLNDTTLAAFLREVEAKETLLIERKRALEQHRLLCKLNGVPEEKLPARNSIESASAEPVGDAEMTASASLEYDDQPEQEIELFELETY
jgi:putative transposase